MKEIITSDTFKCNRYCGKCCKQTLVRVSNVDIKKIKSLGYKEEDFITNDLAFQNKFILKVNDKGCVFLKKHKDGKYSCTIYKNRPKTCQKYPFFRKNKILKTCFPEDRYSKKLLG